MSVEADKNSASKVLKKDIIPDDWKPDIDERLVKDLLYANRYFGSSNPHMAKQVEMEAGSSPAYFYLRLVDRWNWHHSFFEELLEPALPAFVENNHFSVSPHQIDILSEAYKASSLVDLTTLPMTAAIKPHLNLWIEQIGATLTEEERGFLLTPPRETFFAEYTQDHLNYILCMRHDPVKAQELKSALLEKYHADDEDIFSGRMKKLAHYEAWTDDDLTKAIGELSIDEGYKIGHFYSTLERPQLKGIRDTLIYDNYEEYLILMSLIGISGYVLRKRVLQYLNDSKILPNEGSIYEFSDDEVLQGLSKLKEYRRQVLHKDVRPYKQTDLTCGAASLLMAFDYYGILKESRENEDLLHSTSKSAYIDGEHFSGLALEAANKGLETLLIHSYPEMFRNNGVMPEALFNKLMDEYNAYLDEAKAKGTEVRNGQQITSQLIKGLLERDYLVLIAGQMGSYLHAVLSVGYNEQGIIVKDPIDGSTHVADEAELNKFMDSPIGRWVLAIRRDQDALQKLEVQIPKYIGYAKSYLNSERG